MTWYLDTSVALHALLPHGDGRARRWIDEAHSVGGLYSSTLLQLEVIRALRRDGIALSQADELFDRVEFLSVDDGILRSAGTIEPHVRPLDAIHLAACGLLGGTTTIVTHDRGMKRAALELGRPTMDPLDA